MVMLVISGSLNGKEVKILVSNGLRYWRWGGLGLCLGAGKTRSRESSRKWQRIPCIQPRAPQSVAETVYIEDPAKRGCVGHFQ